MAGATVISKLDWAGESTFKLARMVVGKFSSFFDCWPEASVPYHMGLSKGYSQHGSLKLNSLRVRVMVGRTRWKSESFYNLISEVTYHQFCHMLLVIETNPGTMWEGTVQGYEYQEMEIIGDHLGSCLP